MVLGLPIGAVVLLEGGSSLLLVAYDLIAAWRTDRVAQLHTAYDAEIGWVSKKSFSATDMYGPGVGVHTNRRGFRGASEVEDALPPSRARLVCSGDSFTFGPGVADGETWCALLGGPAVETVNMGQVGYGIDQAYLWYMRESRSMKHTFHVFAFVTDDFRRMKLNRFLGYAKPMLAVHADSLLVEGVPTPRNGGVGPARRMKRVVQSLRASEFLGRLTSSHDAPAVAREMPLSSEQLRGVTAQLVAALQRANAAKGSRLVLLYLPIERDFVNDASREWRDHMRTIADSLGVPLIDLVPALRQVPPQQVPLLYFQEQGAVSEGMGHYTVRGNRWVAEQVAAAFDSLGLRPAAVSLPNASSSSRRRAAEHRGPGLR